MKLRDDEKQQDLLDKPFGESGTQKEYLDLWKHFEEIGNNAKSQMITAVNIMLTLASGLLSYIIANTFIQKAANDNTVWCLHNQQVAYAGAILGICLGVLTLGLVYEYRNHAYRNWWRATRCKNEVSKLHFLVTDEMEIKPLSKLKDFKTPWGARGLCLHAVFHSRRVVSFDDGGQHPGPRRMDTSPRSLRCRPHLGSRKDNKWTIH